MIKSEPVMRKEHHENPTPLPPTPKVDAEEYIEDGNSEQEPYAE